MIFKFHPLSMKLVANLLLQLQEDDFRLSFFLLMRVKREKKQKQGKRVELEIDSLHDPRASLLLIIISRTFACSHLKCKS
jgi:hypothetical protein